MFWWVIGLSGRVLAEIAGLRFHVNTVIINTAIVNTVNVNTAIWNLALLAPTILLSANGIGTLIDRGVSRRGEFCLMVLLVGLAIFSKTASWEAGLAGMALITAFLFVVPILVPSLRRIQGGWSEQGWRRLLQITVCASLATCFSVGAGMQNSTSADDERLARLRDQIAELPDVRRVTFLVTRDPVPVTLRYLLRCRWPKAEMVTSDGWDAGLTRALNEESNAPSISILDSRMDHARCPTFGGRGPGMADFARRRSDAFSSPATFHDPDRAENLGHAALAAKSIDPHDSASGSRNSFTCSSGYKTKENSRFRMDELADNRDRIVARAASYSARTVATCDRNSDRIASRRRC